MIYISHNCRTNIRVLPIESARSSLSTNTDSISGRVSDADIVMNNSNSIVNLLSTQPSVSNVESQEIDVEEEDVDAGELELSLRSDSGDPQTENIIPEEKDKQDNTS